ncbi:MAG: DUF6776 family protein [Dokdonella sp.]
MSTPRFEVRPLDPARARRKVLLLVAAWLGSMLLVSAATLAFVSRHSMRTDSAPPVDSTQLDALKSQLAVVQRSEQVAREALAQLQSTLREREEEIAGVRADLAFYGRLVGGAKREGIAVHSLRLTPVPDSRAWNFSATLTQNFKRGPETRGRLKLLVSGVAEGKLQTLEWSELGQQQSSGMEYAFKYFQQIDGTIMFPEGFEPNRVRAIADGEGGRAEQEFPWKDAANAGEDNDVR